MKTKVVHAYSKFLLSKFPFKCYHKNLNKTHSAHGDSSPKIVFKSAYVLAVELEGLLLQIAWNVGWARIDGTDNNPLNEVDDFIWDSDTSTSTFEDFSDVTVKYTTNEQHISTKQLVCVEIDRTVITHRYCKCQLPFLKI
ncbi:hypothetical protein ABEB36_014820 [Hypothenemus hampei]|uniref:Uncharacterized protein n=1 Tax=Hypothenemus hampei TaxID=57062 RepID=A0ABD1E0Z7_HYPHA